MTLLIELLTYGCVTLALIFGIIEHYVELDATTSDEMGFVFIILTIASTLAGGILSLIQVLLLIKDIFQYLKTRKANQKRVKPITLPDVQSPAIRLPNTIFEDGLIGTSETFLKSNPPSATKIKDLSEDEKMFAALRKLSPALFEKGAKEHQLMEELKKWWNSARPVLNIDSNELNLKTQEQETQGSTYNLIHRIKKSFYKH